MRTNQDVIRSLSPRKLAALFVYSHMIPEWDYDYDDHLEQCGESELFVSTLIPGYGADVDDAIDAVEKYLDAEMDEDWEYDLESRERDKDWAVS